MMIDFKAGVRRMPESLPAQAVQTPPAKPKKKEKTPTYNFTLAQIEAMKKDAVDKAVKDAVGALIELTLGLPIMVLHDKHGWGKKRNGQFVDDVMALYDSYERGYITLEDVREALWEEAETRINRKEEETR